MRKLKHSIAAIGLSSLLVAAGCSNDDSNGDNFSENVNYTISGIESGAGIMQAADRALDEYDSLEGWTLLPSSTGPMAIALDNAIRDEDPIIITGWTPHWMFAKYDLKYLEDPKKALGETEHISTMAREGLEQDNPDAYKLLDQFKWSVEEIESVMLEASEEGDPEAAARNWIEDNPDRVAEWTNGVAEGNGQEISLTYTEQDTELASTNVLKHVFEDLGYEVTITPVDIAIMWQSVATGEADATLGGWLPTTHGDLYNEYKDQLVDLGANLEGAKLGLVVPSYVEADSIEDLKPKE
ncbi:glycine betaine ABC transporter substrate-binding protein [Terribacillus saccharophilus]|uniref:glycine betaine ABC transporter substrate-binding protein n=1 Tax=Terribacillus saccharophilus TaxID=361277 RepID=UPI003D2A910D